MRMFVIVAVVSAIMLFRFVQCGEDNQLFVFKNATSCIFVVATLTIIVELILRAVSGGIQ